MPGGEAAEEYHSKDFEWDQLRQEIEADPSLRYHLLPLHVNADDDADDDANSNGPSSSSQSLSGSSSSPSHDSEAWDKFHARHSSGKFFKERRYLLKEFPELLSCNDYSKVLEVGCGNGSTVLPILRTFVSSFKGFPKRADDNEEKPMVWKVEEMSILGDYTRIWGPNVEKRASMYTLVIVAMKLLKGAQEMIDAADLVNVKQRFHPFLCDFSISGFPKWLACEHCREFILQKKDILLPDVKDKIVVAGLNGFSSMKERSCCLGGVDFVTLIFTLSAVPLHRMPAAIAACFSVLKPGGLLLFRDYGLYDMTMLRFEPDKKVGFREYIRSDGTRSYFFCLDTVRDLFVHAGFNELELEYCCVKSVNRRKGKSMQRVWVHGKFQKSM